MQGGHVYKCGHVKHCGDHLQIVQENRVCGICELIYKHIPNINFPNRTERIKALVDNLIESKYVNKNDIW